MTDHTAKVALITGPTSGIGETFAHLLAKEGYDLVLVARHEGKLKKVVELLQNRYQIKVRGVLADLSDEENVNRVENLISSLKQLDLLINNAGFGLGGYFMEVPFQDQMNMLNVHLSSTIRFCRAAIPIMANQRSKGSIINVSSFSAFLDQPGSVMYTTTKSAIVRFSQTLQYEVKDYNIKIQALCPVFTPTSFHKSINRDLEFMKNIPDFFWTPRHDVVMSSLRALHSNKVICVPGRFNKLIYWFNRHPLFASWIQAVVLKLNKRKSVPVPQISEIPIRSSKKIKESYKDFIEVN